MITLYNKGKIVMNWINKISFNKFLEGLYMSLFWPPYWSSYFFGWNWNLCRYLCVIKVLLSCEQRHFLLNFKSHCVNSPLPSALPILLGLIKIYPLQFPRKKGKPTHLSSCIPCQSKYSNINFLLVTRTSFDMRYDSVKSDVEEKLSV